MKVSYLTLAEIRSSNLEPAQSYQRGSANSYYGTPEGTLGLVKCNKQGS